MGIVVTILLASSSAALDARDTQVLAACQQGAAWLSSRQNGDGSWGTAAADRLLYTAEAVRALRALRVTGSTYLRGVAWLEAQRARNADLAARRLMALASQRVNVDLEIAALLGAKVTDGLPWPGWGLTGRERFDPLDTALVLLALGERSSVHYATHLDAVESLAGTVANGSWTIGQADAAHGFRGDVPSTIAAATALRACAAASVPQCNTLLAILPTVESALLAHPPGTVFERAQITGYFAALRAAPPVPMVTLNGLIDLLLVEQHASGEFGDDVLATSTALQAFGRWLGLDRADGMTPVAISNAALRRAVNRALGHHANDAVTRGDLWRLTTLDLSYAPTGTDLTALTPAHNLTAIDISGNPCLLASPGTIEASLRARFPNLVTITRYPVGDVNRDNTVSAVDLQLALADQLGGAMLVGAQQRAADLNADGRRDVRDLFWLERALLAYDLSPLCQ